jgi:hypothetical protein
MTSRIGKPRKLSALSIGALSAKTDSCCPATILPQFAAREVSQRGGGARRGSGAPELMSPKGEIPAQARSDE